MFCGNCGKKIQEGARFCGACGCVVANIKKTAVYNQNTVAREFSYTPSSKANGALGFVGRAILGGLIGGAMGILLFMIFLML